MQQTKNEFDSYWEGESKNKNRNRIRVGKQYQARLPALLKPGESDGRCFQDLETLRWKPNRLPDDQIDQFITLANTLAGRDEPLVPTSNKVYHQGSNVQFGQPTSPSSPSGKASEESVPEVKAMKGKPRSPRLPDAESNASTVGSLKFFMDGQLVLKLSGHKAEDGTTPGFQWLPSPECPASRNEGSRHKLRKHKSQLNKYYKAAKHRIAADKSSSADTSTVTKESPLDLSAPSTKSS